MRIKLIPKSKIEYDSDEEKWFDWWLEEAIKYGMVEDYYGAESFDIYKGLFNYQEIQMKTKKKWNTVWPIRPIGYKPDRVIVWKRNAFNKLFREEYWDRDGNIVKLAHINENTYFHAISYDGKWVSIVDVKPSWGGKLDSSKKFPLKQALIAQNLHLYVQKVVLKPSGKKKATKSHLFFDTWTPERYTWTDSTIGRPRTIHFKYKLAKDYFYGLR